MLRLACGSGTKKFEKDAKRDLVLHVYELVIK